MCRVLCLTLALIAVAVAGLPGAVFAQNTLTVDRGGTPEANVEIFFFTDAGKTSMATTDATGSLGFDPALLRSKGVQIADGTRVTAYGLTCQDGRLRQVVLVPDGRQSSPADLGCRDRDRPVREGQDCDCEPLGAFLWGRNMRVSFRAPAQSAGGTRAATWGLLAIPVGAAVGLGVSLAGDDGDAGGSETFRLSSLSGTYAGSFTQTSTTCNPPAFVSQFNGSVRLTVDDAGGATADLVESITRTYRGTVNRSGGSLTGSGAFPNGMPWTGQVSLTFAESPTRATVTETITNGALTCNAVFRLTDAPRQ